MPHTNELRQFLNFNDDFDGLSLEAHAANITSQCCHQTTSE